MTLLGGGAAACGVAAAALLALLLGLALRASPALSRQPLGSTLRRLLLLGPAPASRPRQRTEAELRLFSDWEVQM